MPRSYTILQVINRAKQYADMENSSFLSDAQWLDFVNSSYTWLYDRLVSSGLAYFESTQSISGVASQVNYALPADHYATVRVDYQLDSSHWERLVPIPVQEVPLVDIGGGNRATHWRLAGTNLQLYPAPSGSDTYRHVYVPAATVFVLTTETVDGVSGFEDLLAIDAAIKALIKEESSTTELRERRLEELARIDEMRSARMLSDSLRIADTDQDEDVINDPADWRIYRWSSW